MKDILMKLKSAWYLLKSHPDNEPDSEMRDRLIDVDSVIRELEEFPRWRKVDRDNLPKGDVLARGLEYQFSIGTLSFYNGIISCEDEVGSILPSVTHYIPVSELLTLETE